MISYNVCLLTSHPVLYMLTYITSYTLYAYLHHFLYSMRSLASLPILYMLLHHILYTYITSYTLYTHLHHTICLLTSHPVLDMLTYITSYYTEGVFTSSGGAWCIYSILTLFEGRKDPSVSPMVFLKEVKCSRILHRRCFHEFRRNKVH